MDVYASGDFNGSVALSYAVSDGELTDTVQTSITVTPVDDAPVIEGLTSVTVEEDARIP